MDGQSAQGVPLALPVPDCLRSAIQMALAKPVAHVSVLTVSPDGVFRWCLQLSKIENSILERVLQQSRHGGTLTQETIK